MFERWLEHLWEDTYPMDGVSWYEAVEYCNKRSIKEGLTPAYRGSGDAITCDWNVNGYRLPTEAEWEYAAKGGNRDLLIYDYSGSNNLDDVGWYNWNSGGTSHPVGMKQPNSLGIYDMSGNVDEWCWDWFSFYSPTQVINPRGPNNGSHRIVRGSRFYEGRGAVDNNEAMCRSAFRMAEKPSMLVGFRIVRSSLTGDLPNAGTVRPAATR